MSKRDVYDRAMEKTMRQLILCVPVLILGFGLGGCDAKKQEDQTVVEQVASDAQAIQDEFDAQMREQLESGEGITPDVGHVENMASIIEEAAEQSSSEQAQALRDQAQSLRKVQALIAPYQEALAEFTELGGLDASTIYELEGFDRRLELVELLDALNNKMDDELPALIREIDENSGSVELDMKIGLIEQIRKTDREMYANMRGYLTILQQTWDQYGVDDAGSIMFSPEVDDELVEAFNVYAQAIQRITAEQARLQRALIELGSP